MAGVTLVVSQDLPRPMPLLLALIAAEWIVGWYLSIISHRPLASHRTNGVSRLNPLCTTVVVLCEISTGVVTTEFTIRNHQIVRSQLKHSKHLSCQLSKAELKILNMTAEYKSSPINRTTSGYRSSRMTSSAVTEVKSGPPDLSLQGAGYEPQSSRA
jgi:hypothetical protein